MIFGLIVGLMLVVGQSLWRFAITRVGGEEINYAAILRSPAQLALHPLFILGCITYIFATILYMYVISRFNYGTSYAIIVACSTIFASLASLYLFKERMSVVNVVGLGVVILGIFLLVKK